jgi:hypothetical protein
MVYRKAADGVAMKGKTKGTDVTMGGKTGMKAGGTAKAKMMAGGGKAKMMASGGKAKMMASGGKAKMMKSGGKV